MRTPSYPGPSERDIVPTGIASAAYSALGSVITDGMMIYDVDGDHFVDANPVALGALELRASELSSISLQQLSPRRQPGGEDSSEYAQRHFDASFGPDMVCMPYLHELPSGARVTVNVEMRGFLIGNRRYVVGTCPVTRHARPGIATLQDGASLLPLVGGAFHDFNNLLTTVLASSDMAIACLSAAHPAAAEMSVGRLAAERAAALSRNLLRQIRRSASERVVIDVLPLVRSLMPVLQRMAGDSCAVTIIEEHVETHLHIRADRVELEQILFNLVTNAREAMPLGGTIAIRISTAEFESPPDAVIGTIHRGLYVILAVEDSGPGIDANVLPHIFDASFSTKNSDTRGFGLASVANVLLSLGGGLTVSNTPPQGARFTVFFPGVR